MDRFLKQAPSLLSCPKPSLVGFDIALCFLPAMLSWNRGYRSTGAGEIFTRPWPIGLKTRTFSLPGSFVYSLQAAMGSATNVFWLISRIIRNSAGLLMARPTANRHHGFA